MSGGSMNYLYSRVQYADFDIGTPERRAFALHLRLVSQALHDIEWVDSGDYGPGDENAAIQACLDKDKALQVENEALLTECRTLLRQNSEWKKRDTALLQQALKALEWSVPKPDSEITHAEAITALRERLGEKA